MGVEVAVGAALVGAAMQYNAGQQAAGAQQDIAEAQLRQQESDRAAASRAAEPSAMELQQLEQAINVNSQEITRKQRLLDSSDPALIEAGTQALNLLRGEEAKTLAPLKNKQAKDRERLREKLRAQLGPGFENTSQGIQALAAFDEASQSALITAQQQSLGQLLGVAQNVQGLASLQSNISNSSQISSQRGAINTRQVNALLGTPITGAGAQFVGGLGNAQNMANLGSNIAGIGGTLASFSSNGAAPTSNVSSGSNSYDVSGGYNLGGNYNFNQKPG
jgi:hypothetical protein